MESVYFKDDFLLYTHKGNIEKITYGDIVSIECDKPYVKFCLANAKSFSIQQSLFVVGNYLKQEFVKVNRQVIVNMRYAQKIVFEGKQCYVYLKGFKYKISVRLEKAVRVAFFRFVG